MNKDLWKNDPATPKQRFTLYRLTKENWKDKDITKGDASELINSLINGKSNTTVTPKSKGNKTNANKAEMKKMYTFMVDNCDEFKNNLMRELKMKSVVEDELDPDDNPRYMFIGSGCGMAWVKYDKRSKIADRFFNGQTGIAYDVIKKFKDYVVKTLVSTNDKDYMMQMGFPLEAMMYQNMSINISILWIAVQYVTNTYGVKNIYVDSRMD